MALKSLIRLGCLVQRLTVYTVATVNSRLPIALDNQPANLCMHQVSLASQTPFRKREVVWGHGVLPFLPPHCGVRSNRSAVFGHMMLIN